MFTLVFPEKKEKYKILKVKVLGTKTSSQIKDFTQSIEMRKNQTASFVQARKIIYTFFNRLRSKVARNFSFFSPSVIVFQGSKAGYRCREGLLYPVVFQDGFPAQSRR